MTPPAPTEAVDPFRIEVPQAQLDDLQRRLTCVRWPDSGPVQDWSQGVPLAAAQGLVAHWRDRYDWRRLERRANGYAQFRTEIDNLGFYGGTVIVRGWFGRFIFSPFLSGFLQSFVILV